MKYVARALQRARGLLKPWQLVDGVETAAHRLKSSFDNEKIHFGSNAACSTMWETTNMSFRNMLERCCLKLNWAITWPTITGSVSSAQSSTSCVAQLCAAMLRLQASGHAHVCRNSKKNLSLLDCRCSLLDLAVVPAGPKLAVSATTTNWDSLWVRDSTCSTRGERLHQLAPEGTGAVSSESAKKSFSKFPARSAVAHNWAHALAGET